MEYFFSTSANPEHPFILFGLLHIALIIWVAFCGWLVIKKGMHGDDNRRRQLRHLLIFLFLVWEVEWQGWYLVTDTWALERALPLHLCSIMIWVSIYGLITRHRFAMALMYFFGIAGAIQAIITPDAVYAFPHFRFMNTWFSHSLLVIAGLWVVFVEGYRPVLSDVWKCLITIHVYAVPVYFVNMRLGSNYLYVGAKPETASVLDFFPEWPGYFFILQVLLALIMLAMYLPFRKSDSALQPASA